MKLSKSGFYPKGLQALTSGAINLLRDTIKVVLVNGSRYHPSPRHRYLRAISLDAVVAIKPLKDKTLSEGTGVFDAADITLNKVSGPQVDYLVIVQDTGDRDTSQLIALIGDNRGSLKGYGLPFLPNGGNVAILWGNGDARIFRYGKA